MNGLVTITKVYDDREEVVVENSPNTITLGMGMSIAKVLTDDPGDILEDYQFAYFQIGTSAHDALGGFSSGDFSNSVERTRSSSIYSLKEPLSSVDLYGDETEINVVERKIYKNKYQFVDVNKVTLETEKQVVARMPESAVTFYNDGILRVKFRIDKEGAVGQTIREVGLFCKNIFKDLDEDKPILAAYKPINPGILKTNDFYLDVEWSFDLRNSSDLSKSLPNVIAFHPSVMPSQDGDNFKNIATVSGFTSSYDVYNVIIETVTPTTHNGYLYYNLKGDAVNEKDYEIIDINKQSPVFIKEGTRKTIIPVKTRSEAFRGEKFLEIELDRFERTYQTDSSAVAVSSLDSPSGVEYYARVGKTIFTDPDASGGGSCPCEPVVTVTSYKTDSRTNRDSYLAYRVVRNGESGFPGSVFRKGDALTGTPSLVGLSFLLDIEGYIEERNLGNDIYDEGDNLFFNHWHGSATPGINGWPKWEVTASATSISVSAALRTDDDLEIPADFSFSNSYWPFSIDVANKSNSQPIASLWASVPCGEAIKYTISAEPNKEQGQLNEKVYLEVDIECQDCE